MPQPIIDGRDRFDGLKCPVPGCRAIIRAITGLQELEKLQAHYRRAHLLNLSLTDALELRARIEEGVSHGR